MMHIVVLVLSLVMGYFVSGLARAFSAVVGVWVVAVLMVGWGPATNPNVHTDSVGGFWVPWLVVLLLALALAYGSHALRARRARRAER